MICISGAIRLRLRFHHQEVSFTLFDEGPGLMVGSGVWAEQTYLVANSTLLVACSEAYNPDSYFTEPIDFDTVVTVERDGQGL